MLFRSLETAVVTGNHTGAVIKSLGGSTQLPMTVIVDAAGKIVYNKVGSVTLTVLEGLVAPLLAE